MKRIMSIKRRQEIIADLLLAELDLIELAKKHGLEHEDLSRWVMKDENHRCLAGLCVLADFQTQLLLSRFRALAVTRLIRLANDEQDTDLARKACVDLLRITVKATEVSADEGSATSPTDIIRRMVYGDETPTDDDAS